MYFIPHTLHVQTRYSGVLSFVTLFSLRLIGLGYRSGKKREALGGADYYYSYYYFCCFHVGDTHTDAHTHTQFTEGVLNDQDEREALVGADYYYSYYYFHIRTHGFPLNGRL